MMQYGHVYTAFCIIIKLKVMFWKLYTRIDFNVGTFKIRCNTNLIERDFLGYLENPLDPHDPRLHFFIVFFMVYL